MALRTTPNHKESIFFVHYHTHAYINMCHWHTFRNVGLLQCAKGGEKSLIRSIDTYLYASAPQNQLKIEAPRENGLCMHTRTYSWQISSKPAHSKLAQHEA